MAKITKFVLIRILELALICVILGLHAHSVVPRMDDWFVSSGTEVGFMIILTGLFAAAMMDRSVDRYVELGFILVGFVLFIASGAIAMDNWRHERTGVTILAESVENAFQQIQKISRNYQSPLTNLWLGTPKFESQSIEVTPESDKEMKLLAARGFMSFIEGAMLLFDAYLVFTKEG